MMTGDDESEERWMPLMRARFDRNRLMELLREQGVDEDKMAALEERSRGDEIWKNHLYQVVVIRDRNPDGPALVSLSIKRLDGRPVEDFRHKQAIKNQLVGTDIEMLELYPAEERLVDTANQCYLWGLDDPTFRWPFGFAVRAVVEGSGDGVPSGPVT
jgi:hypothetical protein